MIATSTDFVRLTVILAREKKEVAVVIISSSWFLDSASYIISSMNISIRKFVLTEVLVLVF